MDDYLENIDEFLDAMKQAWFQVLEPPWQDSLGGSRGIHWTIWLVGWVWAVSGVVVAALIAPAFAQQLGLGRV